MASAQSYEEQVQAIRRVCSASEEAIRRCERDMKLRACLGKGLKKRLVAPRDGDAMREGQEEEEEEEVARVLLQRIVQGESVLQLGEEDLRCMEKVFYEEEEDDKCRDRCGLPNDAWLRQRVIFVKDLWNVPLERTQTLEGEEKGKDAQVGGATSTDMPADRVVGNEICKKDRRESEAAETMVNQADAREEENDVRPPPDNQHTPSSIAPEARDQQREEDDRADGIVDNVAQCAETIVEDNGAGVGDCNAYGGGEGVRDDAGTAAAAAANVNANELDAIISPAIAPVSVHLSPLQVPSAVTMDDFFLSLAPAGANRGGLTECAKAGGVDENHAEDGDDALITPEAHPHVPVAFPVPHAVRVDRRTPTVSAATPLSPVSPVDLDAAFALVSDTIAPLDSAEKPRPDAPAAGAELQPRTRQFASRALSPLFADAATIGGRRTPAPVAAEVAEAHGSAVVDAEGEAAVVVPDWLEKDAVVEGGQVPGESTVQSGAANARAGVPTSAALAGAEEAPAKAGEPDDDGGARECDAAPVTIAAARSAGDGSAEVSDTAVVAPSPASVEDQGTLATMPMPTAAAPPAAAAMPTARETATTTTAMTTRAATRSIAHRSAAVTRVAANTKGMPASACPHADDDDEARSPLPHPDGACAAMSPEVAVGADGKACLDEPEESPVASGAIDPAILVDSPQLALQRRTATETSRAGAASQNGKSRGQLIQLVAVQHLVAAASTVVRQKAATASSPTPQRECIYSTPPPKTLAARSPLGLPLPPSGPQSPASPFSPTSATASPTIGNDDDNGENMAPASRRDGTALDGGARSAAACGAVSPAPVSKAVAASAAQRSNVFRKRSLPSLPSPGASADVGGELRGILKQAVSLDHLREPATPADCHERMLDELAKNRGLISRLVEHLSNAVGAHAAMEAQSARQAQASVQQQQEHQRLQSLRRKSSPPMTRSSRYRPRSHAALAAATATAARTTAAAAAARTASTAAAHQSSSSLPPSPLPPSLLSDVWFEGAESLVGEAKLSLEKSRLLASVTWGGSALDGNDASLSSPTDDAGVDMHASPTPTPMPTPTDAASAPIAERDACAPRRHTARKRRRVSFAAGNALCVYHRHVGDNDAIANRDRGDE